MKRLACLFLALLLVFSMAACAKTAGTPSAQPSAASTATPTASNEKYTLVFSTSTSANSATVKAMQWMADEVERESNGRLAVEIYPDSSLMNEEQVYSACRSGEVDMFFLATSMISDVSPWATITDAAYVIENYDHLRAVFDSEAGQYWADKIREENGVRVLTTFYFGTRNLNLRDIGHEVRTPADLAGVTLRVPNRETYIAMGNGLGANAVGMALSETYLALSTGAVDGQENPLPETYNQKFYEVTKYIVMTKHFVAIVSPAINEEKFQSLPADLQELLMTKMEEARQISDEQVLAQESELLQFMKDQGLTVIEDPDIAAFKTNMMKHYDEIGLSAKWDQKLLEMINELAPSRQS